MTMTNRELKRAIRRNMTTARRHAKAAADLARAHYCVLNKTDEGKAADFDLDLGVSIDQALDALMDACGSGRPWWKNA